MTHLEWMYPNPDTDEVRELQPRARQLQEDRKFTEAFCIYGKILGLQLSNGGKAVQAAVRHTVGQMISIYFQQYPELAHTAQAKESPHGCQVEAFKKLPEETGDLGMLVTMRSVADWYCSQSSSGGFEEADKLYARTFDLMQQAFGPDHLETFRLLHHWGHVCGWAKPETICRDASLAENMYQRALAGFDKLLGRHCSETIDCAHALGGSYISQEKFLLAQALFRLLFEEQAETLGRSHDQTLRSLCALADAYSEQGKWTEARRLIWQIPADGDITSDDWNMSDWGERRSEGQSVHSSVSSALVAHESPREFHWESRALYCLPVRQVRLQATFPSDSDKLESWHPSLPSQKSKETNNTPGTLRYTCKTFRISIST